MTAPAWAVDIPSSAVHPTTTGSELVRPFTAQQLQQMGQEFIEQFLRQVVLALAGYFTPGPHGAAFDQLSAWAADIPILSDIIEALTGVEDGDLTDLGTFGLNLRTFFTGIDFTDPSFDLFTYTRDWIQNILAPTGNVLTEWNLLGQLPGGLDLPFALPGALGSGTPDTPLQRFINHLRVFLTSDFTDPDFNIFDAVIEFVETQLLPTDLLARLVGGQLPDVQAPPIIQEIIDAVAGGIGAGITQIIDRLQHLAGGGQFDAEQLFNVLNIPALDDSSIPGLEAVKAWLEQLLARPVPDFTAPLDVSAVWSDVLQFILAPTGKVLTEWNLTGLLGGVYTPGGAALPAGLPAGLEAPGFVTGSTADTPLQRFIDNLRLFLTSDFTDPDFDILAAVTEFIETQLIPSNLLAAFADIQNVIDTVWQSLTNATNTNNTLAALFEALQNIPFLNVLGVGGPINIGEALTSTWDQLVSGLVGAIGSGAGLADLFNIALDVSSRASLGMFSFDILGIRNNKSINTGFLPTSESNIALDKVALTGTAPTFAVTQSTATTAYLRISEAADKTAVSWLGSGVASITAAFVNIYRMNTTTGLSTLLHGSANIAGILSSTMQYNIFEIPAPIHVEPGDVIGIEIAVQGAGTHSVVGQSTWLPDHPTVYPKRMSSVRNSGTSAAPATIAHSALVYAANIPFVEFAVTSGDPGLPHSPRTDFYGTVGTTTIPMPSWANTVERAVLGGGGGARQGGIGAYGDGGGAASWASDKLVRGVDFTGTPIITITVGAGGAGGNTGLGYGSNGNASTVSIPGRAVTSAGGVGALGQTFGTANYYGRGAGNFTTEDGVVFVGGGNQYTTGAAGVPAGGGGAGGNATLQFGGPGAPGGCFLRFKQ